MSSLTSSAGPYQATGEDGAIYFLQNNADIWKGWVSPEVAEKVQSAL